VENREAEGALWKSREMGKGERAGTIINVLRACLCSHFAYLVMLKRGQQGEGRYQGGLSGLLRQLTGFKFPQK